MDITHASAVVIPSISWTIRRNDTSSNRGNRTTAGDERLYLGVNIIHKIFGFGRDVISYEDEAITWSPFP